MTRLCKKLKPQEGINRQTNDELMQNSWTQLGNEQMIEQG